MIIRLLVLFLIPLALCEPVAAAWVTRDAQTSADETTALSQNDAGQVVEIYRAYDSVYLNFVLSDGFETFSESSCPTFQIDKRKPMHHFEVGPRCSIESKRVTYTLGEINNDDIHSIILHRFMNGSNVTFRYTTGNGRYRQSRFSLRNSKQALKNAIGFNVRILVEE